MFVFQVSQTIVDYHSLSRAVPEGPGPALSSTENLKCWTVKMVPVSTIRPCLLKCLFQDPHN